MIIADILMPNMDGLAMVKEIRNIGGNLPIVVLTAFEDLDYLKRSINIGVDVTSPYRDILRGYLVGRCLLCC